MAGAHENREEERAERSQNRDVVRMLAQQALRNLDQPIHAARCLQNACAGHRRDDDVDDVGRRLAGLQAEAEYEDGKADSRNGTKGKAPVTGTHVECEKHNQELDYH